jgi:hypothetical protein
LPTAVTAVGSGKNQQPLHVEYVCITNTWTTLRLKKFFHSLFSSYFCTLLNIENNKQNNNKNKLTEQWELSEV